MRASVAVAAIIAGVAYAAPRPDYGYGDHGESVVYSTEEVTVTSCGPEVTNCPAKAYSTPAPYSDPASYSTPAPYSVPAPYTTAAPAYTPAPYSSAAAYNVSVPLTTKTIYSTSLITVTSCAAYVTDCPAKSTVVITSVVPISTTVCPVETPYAPSSYVEESSSEIYAVSSAVETPCSTSTTVTVTVSPATTPYATGTGVVPYPSGQTAIWGTASSSGYVTKPSAYPPTFTGAASHANAGMAAVGLGAIAALFL
ncbi:hypothetical protein V2W45_922246 [Cenococcum geophilum]|jgi:hypothetical protein